VHLLPLLRLQTLLLLQLLLLQLQLLHLQFLRLLLLLLLLLPLLLLPLLFPQVTLTSGSQQPGIASLSAKAANYYSCQASF
jgi:hypothetical protein